MDPFTVIALLIILSAVFSYVNERFVKLPGTIGVVTLSVIVSVFILVFGKTRNSITDAVTTLAGQINFSHLVLNIMLGFLLFASALQFDYKQLRALRRPVLLLSTLGVVISALIFATVMYGLVLLLHIPLPFIYCLVFGALISPTDPIAVNALLKKSTVPTALQTILSGESMFNDAVGIILFITFLEIASEPGGKVSLRSISVLFVHEALGGIAIGIIAGYLGYRLIRAVDGHQNKFLLSIALVLAISLLAGAYDASIPLAAVSAGLMVGNGSFGTSHREQRILGGAWQLLDGILNTILFVLMGLQLVLMPFLTAYWLVGLLSIAVILLARLASISVSAIALLKKVRAANLSILTWAGLRGGVSVALALSLPASKYREVILSCCYFIVIFSIIVQGLTLSRLVARIGDKARAAGYRMVD
jgi:CPA1 family monovalent cation:H+ antiporter